MPEFLSFDARGDLYLTLPPADQIRARKVGNDTYAVEFGRLTADVDLHWIAAVQRRLTVAMVEGGSGDDCTTPETLAITGGEEG